MKLAHPAVVWLGAVALLLCLACTWSADEPDPSPTADTAERLTLTSSSGRIAQLTIEIADEPQERTIGLSGRQSLPENAGMLFVFDRRGAGFWMKDTLIPLSVAFIGACGEIVHIADMQPLSLELHNTDRDYSFGLEVNQGWFERNGIRVGDKVSIPAPYRRPECS